MNMYRNIIGSPRFQMAVSDLGDMLKVSLWVAGSAFATKSLELITEWSAGQDFGGYTFIVMGAINILGVGVKKYFTDTRKEVEPEAV